MKQQYRSAKLAAIGGTLFLAVFGISIVVSVFSTIEEISLLRQVENGNVSAHKYLEVSMRQAVIAYLSIAANIAAAIAFLIWIRRASKNLATLGVRGQRFSPGWAVGAWFVPIVSLFRPYQIMVEIWKGSHPRINPDNLGGWRGSPASPLLGFWWGAWLVSNWIGNWTIGLFLRSQTVDDLIRNDVISVVTATISMASLIMALILIWRITSNQEKRRVAYQALLTAGSIVEDADAGAGQDASALPLTQTPDPSARAPRNAQCPKCRRDMTSEDRSFGICGQCRSW